MAAEWHSCCSVLSLTHGIRLGLPLLMKESGMPPISFLSQTHIVEMNNGNNDAGVSVLVFDDSVDSVFSEACEEAVFGLFDVGYFFHYVGDVFYCGGRLCSAFFRRAVDLFSFGSDYSYAANYWLDVLFFRFGFDCQHNFQGDFR